MSDFFSGFSSMVDNLSGGGSVFGDAGSVAGDFTPVTNVADYMPNVDYSTIGNIGDAALVNAGGTDPSIVTNSLSKLGVYDPGSDFSPDTWAGNVNPNAPAGSVAAASGDIPGGYSDAGSALDTANAAGAGGGGLSGGGGGSPSAFSQWWNGLGDNAKKFVWGGLSMGAKAALSMFANPNKDARYLAMKYQTDEQAREYNQNRADRERSHVPSLTSSPGIVNSVVGAGTGTGA